ncbi:DxFTY motif-containing membrane protein [Spiroplasma turonicum]|uniref:Transmembrane protein n=1 Tax=Spiroplasma turonicum TaxID=216946 RepID=A0A0K1P5R2_9MOLU|nr:hypothetical protein [Spiroplasma turonicum]AKU79590.1 hypothetical protein STURON_00344 [Spiroplasma turonicum]ALX70612.1 hypothetical protein STURO_v1c03440 [Spiroplasma turonicum]
MKIFKNFNDCKTPFFKSLLFISMESIIPGLTIWFLLGFDFSYSFKTNLPDPVGIYIFLILFSYVIYTFLSTYIFYLLKLHKADNFTYSLTITMCIVSLYIIGIFIKNESFWILIKFLIIFLTALIFLPISVFITFLFNNLQLKKTEEFEQMLIAYKNGEIIPTSNLIRAQRYQKFLIKKQNEREELAKFKESLESKLQDKLKEDEIIKQQKIQKINSKLDKKEQKKRKKELEKNSDFKK